MRLFYRTILPVVVVGLMAVAVESCHPRNDAEPVDFTAHSDSVSWLIPDYFGDSTYVASRYSVVWPQRIGNHDFQALRDSLLTATFGVSSSIGFEQAAADFLRSPLVDMGADTMKVEPASFDVAQEAQNLTMNSVESSVSLLNPDLLVIEVFSYNYMTHAAHGMQNVRYLNYSIKEQLLFTADNFFLPDAKAKVSEMVERAAKQRYSEQALFADAVYSIDNFRITDETVDFVYQPYEVGPYSSGIITVSINKYNLRDYLTPAAIATLFEN